MRRRTGPGVLLRLWDQRALSSACRLQSRSCLSVRRLTGPKDRTHPPPQQVNGRGLSDEASLEMDRGDPAPLTPPPLQLSTGSEWESPAGPPAGGGRFWSSVRRQTRSLLHILFLQQRDRSSQNRTRTVLVVPQVGPAGLLTVRVLLGCLRNSSGIDYEPFHHPVKPEGRSQTSLGQSEQQNWDELTAVG